MLPRRILESRLFNVLVICCLVLSAVLAVYETESQDNDDQQLDMIQQYMNWFILAVFTLEILLKWLEGFRKFWNTWNTLDLALTALTALPEILQQTEGSQSQKWLKLLIIFRMLRFLKLLLRYPQLRLILRVVFSIFRGMNFRFLFLGILVVHNFFAAIGVYLFDKYTRSSVPGLLYQDDFKDIPNSLLTMFSIFTRNHTKSLLMDIGRVPELNYAACVLFIIVWYIFGGIILYNTIVAFIMESFHAIRASFICETHDVKVQKKAERIRERPGFGMQYHKNTPIEEIDWEVFFRAMENQDEAPSETWSEESLLKHLRLQERLQIDLERKTQQQEKAIQALRKLRGF